MAAVLSVSSAGGPHWVGHLNSVGSSASRITSKDGRFDQFALSEVPAEGESRFRKDLVSRLSQEVRAATTTGEIQSLRQQVQARDYQPDSADIAARLLLMKGADT